MKKEYKTKRLLLTALTLDDTDFIFKLVNTPDWIEFIGDRNIKTNTDAVIYVQKLIDNLNIGYWIVRLEKESKPIGVITFIKRDYLNHHDIGFAFLPDYMKLGYAYEATEAVLFEMSKDRNHAVILATTTEENKNAIRLLGKMGFNYGKEIKADNRDLLLYAISADKVSVNNLTKNCFEVFISSNQKQPDWTIINKLFIPETKFIKKNNAIDTVYNVQTFLESTRTQLNGNFVDFEEIETSSETKIEGGIAKRFSRYQKNVCIEGKYFKEFGSKLFEFNKTNSGWKIVSVTWREDVI